MRTSTAEVELAGSGMVICRYLPGAKVTATGIRENIAARLQLVGDAPHVAVTVLPAAEDFDMTLLKADHYSGPRADDKLRAMAMVAEGPMLHPVMNLYFAYFPTRFNSRVFAHESEAMAWIKEQRALLAG